MKVKIEKVIELYRISYKDQSIIGTNEELEEICLALEEHLYDEPTYEELQSENSSLRNQVERLKDELVESLAPEPAYDKYGGVF